MTVHRNSVWIRNQLDVTFVLSFISPIEVAQHVSGNHVPTFRSWRLRSVIATCWYCAHFTAQYQHVAITLRSRQLLKMGTWLPETCWATCKGKIKDNTKVTSSWFLIHTFKACRLRDTPTGLTFKNCTFCPHCIYVFCIYLRTNSDLCHLQHKLIGFL